ncbi:MAG: type II toxin-antitoxin system Phd/YefM family antitoxin [Acidobacteriota bacterium]|nr:type II toxin-antitoxin system Phd/YefM family antitoxin [Acidobacteriota bacterium]
MSRTIGAAQFRKQCLAILDRVEADGIAITRRGRPAAKLLPVEGASEHLIGYLRGKLRPAGDTMSTGVRWDAEH